MRKKILRLPLDGLYLHQRQRPVAGARHELRSAPDHGHRNQDGGAEDGDRQQDGAKFECHRILPVE